MSQGDDMVQMQMEYRSMGDVLSGSVPTEAPLTSRHHEELDADTFIEWAPDQSGEPRLVSFRMLHARTRTDDDPSLDQLPDPIKQSTLQFFRARNDSLRISIHDESERLDLGSVPVQSLRMRHNLLEPRRGSALQAEMLADELRRLVDTVNDLPGTHDEARVQRFVFALSELASALELSEGLAAPGASAMVRATVRGGVPLTSGERADLLALLIDIDDPSQWSGLTGRLERFIDHFDPGATITE